MKDFTIAATALDTAKKAIDTITDHNKQYIANKANSMFDQIAEYLLSRLDEAGWNCRTVEVVGFPISLHVTKYKSGFADATLYTSDVGRGFYTGMSYAILSVVNTLDGAAREFSTANVKRSRVECSVNSPIMREKVIPNLVENWGEFKPILDDAIDKGIKAALKELETNLEKEIQIRKMFESFEI